MGRQATPLHAQHPAQARLCIVGMDAWRHSIASTLRAVGFEVRVYADGASFLLSGMARHSDGLLAQVPLPDMTLDELQQALAQAQLQLPLLVLCEDAHPAAAGPTAAGLTCLSLPVSQDLLLEAVRHAFERSDAHAPASLTPGG